MELTEIIFLMVIIYKMTKIQILDKIQMLIHIWCPIQHRWIHKYRVKKEVSYYNNLSIGTENGNIEPDRPHFILPKFLPFHPNFPFFHQGEIKINSFW